MSDVTNPQLIDTPPRGRDVRVVIPLRSGPNRGRGPQAHGRGWHLAYQGITNGVPLLVLLAWFLEGRRLPEYELPQPQQVLSRTWDLLAGNAAYYSQTYISFERVGVAVLAALVLGLAIAVTAHYVPLLRGLLIDRLMPFINAFPSIGWAIAGLYWFGVSTTSVIFVEVAIVLPFSLITIWEGLKALDQEMIEMSRSFTRSRQRVLRKVVLPYLAPYLFSALRISYGAAWKVALVAELFGAPSGLGYLLNNAREQLDSQTLFATILTLIILVYTVDKLILQPLEKRILRYRVSSARRHAPDIRKARS
jgi:NitT/TauT family transport system permease protein/sulfonate transport system permease protein